MPKASLLVVATFGMHFRHFPSNFHVDGLSIQEDSCQNNEFFFFFWGG